MVRHVATRRHSNVVLFSCITLVAFVSQVPHHQYVESSPMDWPEFFPLQDCTLCTFVHIRQRIPNHGGGLQCHSPLFIYLSDLRFLFVWAASIPERRTRTQCLSLSSSSSVLKSAASNPAVSGCYSPFQASSLASACGYWPLYHCFSPNYLS